MSIFDTVEPQAISSDQRPVLITLCESYRELYAVQDASAQKIQELQRDFDALHDRVTVLYAAVVVMVIMQIAAVVLLSAPGR